MMNMIRHLAKGAVIVLAVAGLSGPGIGSQKTKPDLASGRFPRVHLNFEAFFRLAQGDGPYSGMFRAMGFGDTEPARGFGGLAIPEKRYPVVEHSGLSLRGARLEYWLMRSLAIGICYAAMGSGSSSGYRRIPVTWRGWVDYSEVYIFERRSSAGYFFTAAWMPVPDGYSNGAVLKLGIEIGACAGRHHFSTSESGIGSPVAGRGSAREVPAAGVYGELDLCSGRVMSVGFRAGYRYARSYVKAFELDGTYLNFTEGYPHDIIHSPIMISFPAHKVNFGGPTIGMSLGFHL